MGGVQDLCRIIAWDVPARTFSLFFDNLTAVIMNHDWMVHDTAYNIDNDDSGAKFD